MAGVRFLHTSDWQLGMTRHFVSDEAAPRYAAARTDAIRAAAGVASREGCQFVVVAGDVFDANLLRPSTVARSLEAMAAFEVPVYLLPGNHDPLSAESIYHQRDFRRAQPANVHVLDSTTPVVVTPGVEVVGAPWFTKRPLTDLAAEAVAELTADGTVRVLVAHGETEDMGKLNPARIDVARLRASLDAGAIHYVALGDRHSVGPVRGQDRMWYSGSQEVTDFRGDERGEVLVVDLGEDGSTCTVTPQRVGSWRFLVHRADMSSMADVAAVDAFLTALSPRERCVVKTAFQGTLSVREHAALEEVLERHRPALAGLSTWERHEDVVVVADDTDLADVGVGGFVAEVAADLQRAARGGDGGEAAVASDALALLYRLAQGGSR